ncbi:MAG TPA: DUF4294 domain-containing protein [Chitinophagaceae bacterium]|nr:DUF4294 domain-containing protein [Chitinophagaceae bacterium]
MASTASGQDGRLGKHDTILVNTIVYQGDTIPAKTLEWVWVDGYFSPAQRKKKAEWTRLRNAVYVTYPYARRAGAIINDINSKLATIPSKKRKDYLKTREKELKKEFADPLSDLSVYQGKVLMKLINRQTGNNCYELITEYKGSFTARFWQTVAFVFGSNLKQAYDAGGEDRQIESIVEEVERMYN